MKHNLQPDHVRSLGYALETLFNEAEDEDDICEAIEDMTAQWQDSPDFARTIRDHWRRVLCEADPTIAQHLILNWARQGKYSPSEASDLLQQWYDRLEPLWSQIGTPRPGSR